MQKRTGVIALLTVVVARVALFTTEKNNFNHYVVLSGFRWHHFYTGALVWLVGLFIPRRQHWLRPLAIGIGLGLMIDEITLPLELAGLFHIPYWSANAFLAIVVCVALIWFDLLRHHRRHYKRRGAA